MVAFRVQLNHEEPITAGLPGKHVLSVFVDCDASHRRGQQPETSPVRLQMSVGGLRTSEEGFGTHVRWLRRALEVGDQITIAVVEVSESDVSRPFEETTATEASESDERKQLAQLIVKYGAP